jgi:hypothetical protein
MDSFMSTNVEDAFSFYFLLKQQFCVVCFRLNSSVILSQNMHHITVKHSLRAIYNLSVTIVSKKRSLRNNHLL